ncbi:tetratricopeptide repeat protein [Paludibaculum fermentans]|uniref:tetratricopeptide repeat protein n=1 Tax=Paludibaculum fermentans TaxID=1473598 RepID=UPI003EBCA08A
MIATFARVTLGATLLLALAGQDRPAVKPAITVDYPLNGAVFPPEFPAPVFEWRDAAAEATSWTIDVSFSGGQPGLHARSAGERYTLGKIDPRCVSPNNKPPALTPEQAVGHTWKPDAATWAAIKRYSTDGGATITLSGYAAADPAKVVSQGRVTIQTSRDPVGAPIFYRDVPLMPSDAEKGVIKPLASTAIPLIAWRLRNVAETSSRVVLEGMHSCANCHSFSGDGKTMGMDLDGPRNDKGLYALYPIKPQTTITKENVVAWSAFRGKLGGKLRVGFMSQVSPTGQYVVTTINDPGKAESDYQRRIYRRDFNSNYYVANFKDYRFLQVFYPTRGILAWYSRATGRLEPLPGADDARFVHTNAVWSPDGKYLYFARAEAKEPYALGVKLAERANDPNETQMKFEIYRIPFNGGKGGVAEPVAGASKNGMSNSFPKISPDGRWLIFVKCGNGLLMRPDGKLYIVPAGGGEARLMNANTKLMNSWHSFSPNSRWLVFSSKSRSPYTQLFLTHIDEQGNDSPAILIDNSTAANRAVNIPEFVNIPQDGLMKINAPVTEYYRLIDVAEEHLRKGELEPAIAGFRKALADDADDPMIHNSLGVALSRTGHPEEAVVEYRKAIALSADFPDAYNNLGGLLLSAGRVDEAIGNFEKALQYSPDYAEAHSNLGAALAQQGRIDRALPHMEKSVEYKPNDANARRNLALALYRMGRVKEAVPQAAQAVKLAGGRDPNMLALLSRLYAEAGRMPEAVDAARRALALVPNPAGFQFAEELRQRIAANPATKR